MDLVSVVANNPLSSALALLFSAWLGYRLSIDKDAVAHRRAIGRHILTDAAFKKHEAAILDNIGGLSWFQQLRLRRAWEQLTCPTKCERRVHSYFQYIDSGSLEKRRLIRPLAIAGLQGIISIVK